MEDILDDFSQSEEKNRHGCVAAWLWFSIVASLLAALLYLLGGEFVNQSMELSGSEPLSKTMMITYSTISIIGIYGYYMILQWKKTGFYIIIGISLLSGLWSYMSNGDIIMTIASIFIGPIILFLILQIRKDGITAWDHLE